MFEDQEGNHKENKRHDPFEHDRWKKHTNNFAIAFSFLLLCAKKCQMSKKQKQNKAMTRATLQKIQF